MKRDLLARKDHPLAILREQANMKRDLLAKKDHPLAILREPAIVHEDLLTKNHRPLAILREPAIVPNDPLTNHGDPLAASATPAANPGGSPSRCENRAPPTQAAPERALYSRRDGAGGTQSTRSTTSATPARTIPSSAAAWRERSMILPCAYGPRSLMRTRTCRPSSRETSTTLPSGSVRCAAV
jgi:hypothetical protein